MKFSTVAFIVLFTIAQQASAEHKLKEISRKIISGLRNNNFSIAKMTEMKKKILEDPAILRRYEKEYKADPAMKERKCPTPADFKRTAEIKLYKAKGDAGYQFVKDEDGFEEKKLIPAKRLNELTKLNFEYYINGGVCGGVTAHGTDSKFRDFSSRVLDSIKGTESTSWELVYIPPRLDSKGVPTAWSGGIAKVPLPHLLFDPESITMEAADALELARKCKKQPQNLKEIVTVNLRIRWVDSSYSAADFRGIGPVMEFTNSGGAGAQVFTNSKPLYIKTFAYTESRLRGK